MITISLSDLSNETLKSLLYDLSKHAHLALYRDTHKAIADELASRHQQ